MTMTSTPLEVFHKNPKFECSKQDFLFQVLNFEPSNLFRISIFEFRIYVLAPFNTVASK